MCCMNERKRLFQTQQNYRIVLCRELVLQNLRGSLQTLRLCLSLTSAAVRAARRLPVARTCSLNQVGQPFMPSSPELPLRASELPKYCNVRAPHSTGLNVEEELGRMWRFLKCCHAGQGLKLQVQQP